MSDLLREFPPIEWDDGYPTEESMEALDAANRNSFGLVEAGRYLRQELAKCAGHCVASYEERAVNGKPLLHLHFSTGGWSGAEDLIAALQRKFWVNYALIEWRRGGHYVFEVST